MQIGQTQALRSDWYDRAVQAEVRDFGITGGPHALAIQDTYTIPANRIFRLESVHVRLKRITVATTPRDFSAYLRVRIDGVVLDGVYGLSTLTNVVDDEDMATIPVGLLLPAGAKIELLTEDASTGGTTTISIYGNGNSYDA